MRLSPSASRTLVLLIFVLSAVAGIETGRYRYIELAAQAHGVYAAPLAHYGFSPAGFVLYFLVTEGLVAAAFALTGLFIALRGPQTPMAVFAAISMMLYGVTIPPPMHALVVNAPALPPWLLVERSLGLALFVIFLYGFPDGRYTAWPIRALSAIVLVWTFLWTFVPATNPYHFTHPWPFVAIASLFASAVVVQLYWYYRVRTTLEKQQTKWVVYAVTASVAGDFVTHLPWQVVNLQRGPDLPVLLIHQPFFAAFQIAVPLAIGFSVLYFHLWEIDFIVSRTVLYAMITTAVAVLWEAINLTVNKLITQAMGPQSQAFAGGTATVVTGFLLKPMYEKLKSVVDKRLTPPTLDLSDEFPELATDVRHRLTLPHVVNALADHVPPLFDVSGSAVYLYRDGILSRYAARASDVSIAGGAVPPDAVPDADALDALRQGKIARLGDEENAPVFVPLVVPRSKNPDLLGVLVLGPRDDEKGYSQLEIGALEELGRKAGMAIYLSEARNASEARGAAAASAAHAERLPPAAHPVVRVPPDEFVPER